MPNNDDEPRVEPKVEQREIWNGGTTNEYNKMWRESEDYYDEIDSETTFRDELRERQKIMNKTRIKRPLHELYTKIDYNKKTEISRMGGKGGPVESIKSRNEK